MIDVKKIRAHYEHANKKHPLFCYGLTPVDLGESPDAVRAFVKKKLQQSRKDLEQLCKDKVTMFTDILDCEIWEINEALCERRYPDAIEECYDAIAVLLRTIHTINKITNPKRKVKSKWINNVKPSTRKPKPCHPKSQTVQRNKERDMDFMKQANTTHRCFECPIYDKKRQVCPVLGKQRVPNAGMCKYGEKQLQLKSRF